MSNLTHIREFDIEVWFLAYDPEAEGGQLILYNGQRPNGDGDFLALTLARGGRLRLRFDLGSGPAELTTAEAAVPGRWHAARLTRAGPRGTLRLDEGKVVEGSAPAPLTELNLELPLYLGGYRYKCLPI